MKLMELANAEVCPLKPVMRNASPVLMRCLFLQKQAVSHSGRADTSQQRDWLPFRNGVCLDSPHAGDGASWAVVHWLWYCADQTVDGRPTHITNGFVARLPLSGLVTFDFSTSLRPPLAARTAPLRAIRFLIRYCGLKAGSTFGGVTIDSKPEAVTVPKLFDPRERAAHGANDVGDGTTEGGSGNGLDDLSSIHTPAVTEDLAAKLRTLHQDSMEFASVIESEFGGDNTWDKEAVHPMVGFRFGGDDDLEEGWDDEVQSNMLWDKLRGNFSCVVVAQAEFSARTWGSEVTSLCVLPAFRFVAVNEQLKHKSDRDSAASSIHGEDFHEQEPVRRNRMKLVKRGDNSLAPVETNDGQSAKGPLMFRKLLRANSERVLTKMPSLRAAIGSGTVRSELGAKSSSAASLVGALANASAAAKAADGREDGGAGDGGSPTSGGLASPTKSVRFRMGLDSVSELDIDGLVDETHHDDSGDDNAGVEPGSDSDAEGADTRGSGNVDSGGAAKSSSSMFASLAHALNKSSNVKSGGILGSLLIKRSSRPAEAQQAVDQKQRKQAKKLRGERVVIAEEASENFARSALLQQGGGELYDLILRRRLGLLRSIAALLYFNSVQAVRIARRFPSMIKNARVEALVVLSSRVVDGAIRVVTRFRVPDASWCVCVGVDVFACVLRAFLCVWLRATGGLFTLAEQILTPAERIELTRRLGYLNLVNPWQPDHFYDLDLAVRARESDWAAMVWPSHSLACSNMSTGRSLRSLLSLQLPSQVREVVRRTA